MLSDVPFTRTVDSQAGGIHNHVPRPAARTDGQGRRQGTLPSTDSAVVWNGKIESQQLQERRNEARRRPKAKLKHRLQHPCALDGRVGIDFRSAGGPLCGSALRQAAMAFSSNQKAGLPLAISARLESGQLHTRYRKVYPFGVIPHAGTPGDQRQADTATRFMQQRASVFTAFQLAPPSELLKTPFSVPQYKPVRILGADYRRFALPEAPVPKSTQLFPRFFLFSIRPAKPLPGTPEWRLLTTTALGWGLEG